MMQFSKYFLALPALIALLIIPAAVFAQHDAAGVTQAVEEAKKAGVPDATVNRLLSLGYEKGVEPASMAGLICLLGDVKKDDLPMEPFVSKIEEGMAKRVPATSIERVLSQKKEDYLFTRSITSGYLKKHGLQQQLHPEDLAGITESLYSGLTRQELTHTLEDAPAAQVSSLNRAINLKAALKQVGFDPKLSDQIISTGLRHNFFTPQQRDFARAIVTGKRKGVADAKITDAAISTMQSGGTVAGFCSQIGVSNADMGQQGPRMMSPGSSMEGMGQSTGMGGMGRGMSSGSAGGMGGATGGMGGGGRGGGGHR